MVREILQDLDLVPGMVAVDGTLGLGGHAMQIVERIAPGGTLLGLDWDGSMLVLARERLRSGPGVRLIFERADFRTLSQAAERESLRPDAILLDLGLNSAQVDDPERGFSFQEPGPLDMRMNRAELEPASAVLNRMALGEIEEMLLEYGDERWARAIAKEIVDRRRRSPISTTQDLVECVLAAIPPRARDKRIHPATRTFQALRIHVNRELVGLGDAVTDAARSLAPGGTLAVLSYHSGEDRIIKTAFRALAAAGFVELHPKPSTATLDEIRRNPRSRSAKLRSLRGPGSRQRPGHSDK